MKFLHTFLSSPSSLLPLSLLNPPLAPLPSLVMPLTSLIPSNSSPRVLAMGDPPLNFPPLVPRPSLWQEPNKAFLPKPLFSGR